MIGDCETAALVNSDGGIDWLCLPAFDGPSFFAALLDREKGGEFSIRPAGEFRIEQTYAGDTAILETRFISEHSTVLLTDFFVIARKRNARFYDYTSLHPTRKLVRLLRIERGDQAMLDVRVAARPGYAREQAEWRPVAGGFASREAGLFSNLPLAQRDGDLVCRAVLEAGKSYFAVLDYADARTQPSIDQVQAWLATTKAFWNEWNLFNYYRGAHESVVRRSAVTLKLLTYAPTGAFVAAPTTSLPEKPGGESNWDYRYTWIRDTALFINTLFRIGYSGEAKAFFQFVCKEHDRGENSDGKLPVLLPIREDTPTDETQLDHLSGYAGSRPVRIGNRAPGQLQLDNYGHILKSLFYWKHTGGKLSNEMRQIGERAVAELRRSWSEPDNGIWEPVERKQHTYSKVTAWLAFARAADLDLIDRYEAERLCGEIRDEVLRCGTFERDGETWLADIFGGDRVDCTAFLTFTEGFLDDALARSTRHRIEQQLAEEPWIYRSETHRATGEGAFLLCSFWWIGQLIREGDLPRAEKLLNQIIEAASPLGLYSEEVDPNSAEFLGNFPQAFSHLGLISAILDLQRAKRDRRFAKLPDHEKFRKSVGATIGLRGLLAGFFRVPRTIRLLFRTRSKWREAA